MATLAETPPSASGFTFSESLLSEIPRGAWVAISSDGLRVISYSADMKMVLQQANERGESDPILTRVPESCTALFF